MYIYKDITNTQWDISFVFSFFVCLFSCVLRFASMTEELTDVCVCIDCEAKMIQVLQCAVALT